MDLKIKIIESGQNLALFDIVGEVQKKARGFQFCALHLVQGADALFLIKGESTPTAGYTFEALLQEARATYPGISFQDIYLHVNGKTITLVGTRSLFGPCKPCQNT